AGGTAPLSSGGNGQVGAADPRGQHQGQRTSANPIDRRRVIELLGTAALAATVPASARAQAAYPTRFVRLVVPFPPGGGTDAIARVVSAKLSAIWGQQMVVENKGGGATSIGTDTVAKSDPDGYTVLLQSVPLAVHKFLFATF